MAAKKDIDIPLNNHLVAFATMLGACTAEDLKEAKAAITELGQYVRQEISSREKRLARRLYWHGASSRFQGRARRALMAWREHRHGLWMEAWLAASPYLERGDGLAAYCAGWVASHQDRRIAASTTREIPEPVMWVAGNELGTDGPTTTQPGLLKCNGDTWPIPWEHRGHTDLRAAWMRIFQRENA